MTTPTDVQMMNRAAEYANKCADLIEKNGLAKGMYHDEISGGYCAMGAVRAVQDRYGTRGLCVRNVVVEALFEKTNGAITNWNDYPKRTKDDVVGVFRQIAEELA